MNYNEWLELLETLKKSSKIEYVEKFKNEPLNENLKEMLKPKIKEMIDQRFNRSISR